MFIAANFISALAQVLDVILNIYMWVIIFRSLISWVNPDPYNPIVQFLYRITEPVLSPIRRTIGRYAIGIDLSPVIVILLILFLQAFLVQSLVQMARRMA